MYFEWRGRRRKEKKSGGPGSSEGGVPDEEKGTGTPSGGPQHSERRRRTMKLLTLNTHSIVEENYEEKLHQFADWIIREQPDIIALQEVNQSVGEKEAESPEQSGYVPCRSDQKYNQERDYNCNPGYAHRFPALRRDNHALRTAQLLERAGVFYCWTWIPLKIGYDIYEEGLAIMSRQPIEDTDQFFISEARDFHNWKTRKMLGIRVENCWYYTAHMSWWDDPEEPFAKQWDHVMQNLADKKQCFVMGDFNCPAEISGEGYDYVCVSGWHDTYSLAKEKDEGITVGTVIDGWRERMDKAVDGMRIDQIWSKEPVGVKGSQVILNGKRGPVVSDHYGVEVMLE